MKIEVGKFYKTRDGRKVRIYAVDGCEPYPIHGAILMNCGTSWEVMTCTGIGQQNCTLFENEKDLISEWEEPKPKRKAWITNSGAVCFMGCGRDEWYGWTRAPWLDGP